MRNLVVLIPEGFYVNYFVYSGREVRSPDEREYELQRKGRIRSRDSAASTEDIRNILDKYRPEAVAIRVLYGGEDFKKTVVYDRSLLPQLEDLIPESPLHMSLIIKLIKTLERGVPVPDILLFFDTAFFVDLPIQERIYALDSEYLDMHEGPLGTVRRFGYHGLYHQAAWGRIADQDRNAGRVVSICLEPVPEVVGIYDGKPVMVSGGSTPMEGIPGNTTCGEIDPGILLLIEERKKWGPEMINEILGRRSGLTALAGKTVSIDRVLAHGEMYGPAKRLLEYRLLSACGSAIAVMGGFDAIAFSGRYVDSAWILAGDLVPRLTAASRAKSRPAVFHLRDTLQQIIVESICRSMSSNLNPAQITITGTERDGRLNYSFERNLK